MVIKKQMINWPLVEICVYMPFIHGSEFSCRYRAFVTLYHWDMPQTLEDEYGKFRNKKVV
jgi:hypothetical protein